MACRHDDRDLVPANVHHMLAGGRRISHNHTYGLCTEHHVGDISIHGSKRTFLEKYGSEDSLLEKTNELVALYESKIIGGMR